MENNIYGNGNNPENANRTGEYVSGAETANVRQNDSAADNINNPGGASSFAQNTDQQGTQNENTVNGQYSMVHPAGGTTIL